jgi:hypothetical protein
VIAPAVCRASATQAVLAHDEVDRVSFDLEVNVTPFHLPSGVESRDPHLIVEIRPHDLCKSNS